VGWRYYADVGQFMVAKFCYHKTTAHASPKHQNAGTGNRSPDGCAVIPSLGYFVSMIGKSALLPLIDKVI